MIEHSFILFALAVGAGFFMAWGVGANDVANTMGTSVGSKALSIKGAIVVAGIFEAFGALLAGGQVTETIRSRIIDIHVFSTSPELLVYGMLAALLASGVWLLVATLFGWPVSTTHTIIGALVGFATTTMGWHAVNWSFMINIVLTWILTPIIASVLAYLLFLSVQFLILNTEKAFYNAKRFVPAYIFLVAFVIASVTLTQGLKHLGLHLTTIDILFLTVLFSLLTTAVGGIVLRRIRVADDADRDTVTRKVEAVFGILTIFTGCAMAFAHGSNDVANAIGPLAAIVCALGHGAHSIQACGLPLWILLIGAVGMLLGLGTYGYRVIATIGNKITQLTPSRGFAAQLATAATVVVSSGIGIPVSTTQTLVGAVLGVGFARGIGALNLSVIRNIFMSWVVTLPAGAVLAILFFHLIRWVFG